VGEGAGQLLLRVEASIAMMRLGLDAPLIVAAGWLCAGRALLDARFFCTTISLVLARGSSNVINDIVGREEDRLSNPWLPLPSGLLDLRQAVATLLALAAGVVGFAAAASASWSAFAVSLGLLVLGGVLIVGYSLMSGGLPAIAVAAMPYPVLALIAWALAQEGGAQIAPVLVACWCYGAGSQILGKVWDVDADREQGKRTVAVRFGPADSLRAAAACDLGAIAGALLAAAGQGRLPPVLGLAVLLLVALLAAYRDAVPQQESAGVHGRFARVKAMRTLSRARLGTLLLLLAAFSIWAAAALALIAAAALPLLARHERRVVGGTLRRRMLA
jgi:4-hydroxybenzoate polyprenyltransferase